MPVRITEIVSRSEQGVTRPFLCRAENDGLYYVKGNYAGRKALCAELIAATLAYPLGLPIPQFEIATVAPEIVRYSARDDIADLGAGSVFASLKIDDADELRAPFVEQIDPALRAKILLFDWWICNPDRTLTLDGGNPNLLWMARDRKLTVIDHNLAFEQNDMSDFWSTHVFRRDVSSWNEPFREETIPLLRAAIGVLPGVWQELPVEWTEAATGFTLESVTKLLSRFENNSRTFWRLT